jgi:hypothetical protein
MKIDLAHLANNWKSTVQSILTTVFALTGTLMVSNVISSKTAAIMAAVNGICKIVLGVFQTDGVQIPAGSTVIQTSKTTVTAPDVKL